MQTEGLTSVERAVEAGLPQEYSWLLAHGLTVSLVWMYLEILRLLNVVHR